MNENNPKQNDSAWEEVGKQFQSFGESLNKAFQTTINNEENKKRFQEIEGNLINALDNLTDSIENGLNSAEGQEFKETAKNTADSLIDAGEKAVEEVRPHLLNALEKVNQKLTEWINTQNQDSDS